MAIICRACRRALYCDTNSVDPHDWYTEWRVPCTTDDGVHVPFGSAE